MEKNSFVRMFILRELLDGERSGYDLIHKIAEHNGGKKPSPGTLYPLLKDLEETKQIRSKAEGRKKSYSLTKKGEKTIRELAARQETILDEQKRMMKLFSGLSGKPKKSAVGLNLVKTPLMMNKWLRYNMDIVGELKQETMKVMSMPFDEKKAQVWRKDMQRTLTTLRNMRK